MLSTLLTHSPSATCISKFAEVYVLYIYISQKRISFGLKYDGNAESYFYTKIKNVIASIIQEYKHCEENKIKLTEQVA
jgi:hypothetical protein